jgi:AraC-like DNA-binding protein
MRTIHSARPRLELTEFVRSYAQREVVANNADSSQSNVAALESCIAFEFGDPMIMDYPNGQTKFCPRIACFGPTTAPPLTFRFRGHTINFAIFLRPLALKQLFRIDPGVVVNRDFEGSSVFGHGVQELWLKLAERSTFLERVRVAEEYLLPFALHALVRTPIMLSAQHIIRRMGATRIDEVANHTALSLRQFERRFADEIGLRPKLFARITRFQIALDVKRVAPHRSWLSVAHQLGYFDQMHMIRDFQSLGGGSPVQIINQFGDLHPWSLASTSRVPFDISR